MDYLKSTRFHLFGSLGIYRHPIETDYSTLSTSMGVCHLRAERPDTCPAAHHLQH